jgi:hypothetical protein
MRSPPRGCGAVATRTPASSCRRLTDSIHPGAPRLASPNHLPSTTRQHTAAAPGGPARRRAGGRPQQEGRPPRASRAGNKLESEQHELPDRRDPSPCRARIGESRPPDWGSRDSDAGHPPSLLPSPPRLSLLFLCLCPPDPLPLSASASRGFVALARENKFYFLTGLAQAFCGCLPLLLRSRSFASPARFCSVDLPGWPALADAGFLFSCLVPPILPKFHYAKRRFSVTLKCWQMHGVLNVDKIKN